MENIWIFIKEWSIVNERKIGEKGDIEDSLLVTIEAKLQMVIHDRYDIKTQFVNSNLRISDM